MLDFLAWGSLSFVQMALILQYYMDKLVNPDPEKLPDGRYESAPMPAAAQSGRRS
jgi:hypothetical protein